jgi:hypothetical protein
MCFFCSSLAAWQRPAKRKAALMATNNLRMEISFYEMAIRMRRARRLRKLAGGNGFAD